MFKTRHLRFKSRLALIAAAALFAMTAGTAQAVEVTGSFTGWWNQPDQQNHGVLVSVTELPSGERFAVFYWANFDDQGKPAWLYGEGQILGDTVQADLYQFEGVTFMQSNDPNLNAGKKIGSMQVQFNDCNQGDVSYNAPEVIVGTGGAPQQFKIERLTNQPGVICTGGISDNTRPNALPEVFRVFLVPPTGAPVPGATGKADFESRAGLAEFSVEIEDLPLGDYTLQIGGVVKATITVSSTPTGNEGEIEFRSPADPSRPLLTFDPRDQLIEILNAGNQVMLATLAPATGEVPGSTEGSPPPFGDEEIEIDFDNPGVIATAYGSAELERESNRVDFDVDIEDLPVGEYGLRVDGTERARIQVIDTPSGPEGEASFRFPAESGKQPLDFDPRGALIEIVDGNTAVLTTSFPATGVSDDEQDGSDDEEDDEDGGGDDDEEDGDGDDDGGGDDDDEDDG